MPIPEDVIKEMFQSTRPRGRTRLILFRALSRAQNSNPRVLAGGRDTHYLDRHNRVRNFNPRVLAGGRDVAEAALYDYIHISIHASSREDATVQL